MIFLQDNLTQAVNSVNKASIELAQAASDYGALKVVFGIFIVFMIILILMFIYQIFRLNSKIDTIYDSSIEVTRYFDNVADNTIGDVQVNVMLRRSFNHLSTMVKYNILKIRLENNIKDNQDKIKDKVKRLINNELIEIKSFLNNFNYKDRPLTLDILEEDINVIIESMMEQIYDENFKISQMDSALEIIMQGLKLHYLNRL